MLRIKGTKAAVNVTDHCSNNKYSKYWEGGKVLLKWVISVSLPIIVSLDATQPVQTLLCTVYSVKF
jgi:hypothetical protein